MKLTCSFKKKHSLEKRQAEAKRILEKYSDKIDDYRCMFYNPIISLTCMLKYNDEIVWDAISLNPNLSLIFIEKNLDNINFNKLSLNTFKNINTKQKVICNTQKYKDELLFKTWHPKRIFNWILTDEQKDRIKKNFIYNI